MTIETLTSKAVNSLPIDIPNQHDDQISRDENEFSSSLIAVDNQILNYNPEQFQNKGNSLSSQIIESLASLDTSIKSLNNLEIKPWNKVVKSVETHKSTSKINFDNIDKPDSDMSYADIRKAMAYDAKENLRVLTKARKISLTIITVQGLATAFTKTLNKFLRM